MDPALFEMFSEGAPDDEVAVILRLADPTAVPAGVRIVARFGNIATCRLRRGDIPWVRGDTSVSSVKAPRLYSPTLDAEEADANLEILDSDIRRPTDDLPTGKGVIVAHIDWGVDVAHPNFRTPQGGSRLLALWNQSAPMDPQQPNRYGYGRVFDTAGINRALAAPCPYQALDYDPADSDPRSGSHGTHTLSISGGNGGGGGPIGLAPEADLVFVHLSTYTAEGPTELGDSVALLEALDFIARTAGARPFVVNASLGRTGGAHTGNSLTEQGMDAFLLEAPGRAIVQSCGNYFDRHIHNQGILRPGERRTLCMIAEEPGRTPNEIDLWYPGVDRFGISLRGPRDSVDVSAAPGERVNVTFQGGLVGRLHHRIGDPNNGENQVQLFLFKGCPVGEWRLTLAGDDVSDGRFHVWVDRDSSGRANRAYFAPADDVPSTTTGCICNGLRTIATGAYDVHDLMRPLAHFSSSGPTADGRGKPDLVAAGVRVLAARSHPRDAGADAPKLTRMSGTSMAAPHVTGTIALMFAAANRSLHISETRRLLLSATDPPSDDAAASDLLRLGNGYLNTTAAVKAVREMMQPRPASGYAVQAPPLTVSDRPVGETGLVSIERIPEMSGSSGFVEERSELEGRKESVSQEIPGSSGGRVSLPPPLTDLPPPPLPPSPSPFQFDVPITGGAPGLALPIGGSGSPFALALPLDGPTPPAPSPGPGPSAATTQPVAATQPPEPLSDAPVTVAADIPLYVPPSAGETAEEAEAPSTLEERREDDTFRSVRKPSVFAPPPPVAPPAPSPLPFQFDIPLTGGAPGLALPIGGPGSPFAFTLPLGGAPAPSPSPAPSASPSPGAASTQPTSATQPAEPPSDAPVVAPDDTPLYVPPSAGEAYEGAESSLDEGERLLGAGDAAASAGGAGPRSSSEMLGLLLGPLFDGAPATHGDIGAFGWSGLGGRWPSATALFNAFVSPDRPRQSRDARYRQYAALFKALGYPGDPLRGVELRPGDLLLRVARGEGWGHVAIIASPGLHRLEQLAARGLRGEGYPVLLPGAYVHVVEIYPRRRASDVRFARRVCDDRGAVLGDTLLLRLRPARARGESAEAEPDGGLEPTIRPMQALPLRMGSSGAVVRDCQLQLNRVHADLIALGLPGLPFCPLEPDGRFTRHMEQAVVALKQQVFDDPSQWDAVIDSATKAKLDQLAGPAPDSTRPPRGRDQGLAIPEFALPAEAPSTSVPTQLDRPTAVAQAEAMINRFRAQTFPGKWDASLDRQRVADRLLALIGNPNLVNQGANGLCGEAAFFNIWLWEDPFAVARFCVQLYNGGAASVGTEEWVRPRPSLRSQNFDKVAAQMAKNPLFSQAANWSADWMVMSALRDANNWIISYDGTPSDEWGAGSSNQEVVRWLQATGLFSQVSSERGDPLNLNPRTDIILVSCDSHMLGNRAHPGDPEDDHYFVLRSAVIEEANATVNFYFWSWGEPIQLVNDRRADPKRVGQPLPGPLSKAQFTREYFAHILARRPTQRATPPGAEAISALPAALFSRAEAEAANFAEASPSYPCSGELSPFGQAGRAANLSAGRRSRPQFVGGRPLCLGETDLVPTAPGGSIDLLIWNFDIDGSYTKIAHEAALDRLIAEMHTRLRGPTPSATSFTVRLSGLASRTGDAAYNATLATEREATVEAYLRANMEKFAAPGEAPVGPSVTFVRDPGGFDPAAPPSAESAHARSARVVAVPAGGVIPPPRPFPTTEIAFVLDDDNDTIVDERAPVTTFLRFGLWNHAYFPAGDPREGDVRNGQAEVDNFVGSDRRRFYIRVRDPSATTSRVNASWKTMLSDGATDDDAPASQAITLTETRSGSHVFVSKALMLVTDETDAAQDTHSGLHPPLTEAGVRRRGQSNHRLRRARIDGFVFAEYRPTSGAPANVRLPAFQRAPTDERRRVKVNVVNYNTSAAVDYVAGQFSHANQRWNQIGLLIEPQPTANRKIPAGVLNPDGTYHDDYHNFVAGPGLLALLNDLIPISKDNSVTVAFLPLWGANAFTPLFDAAPPATASPLLDRFFVFIDANLDLTNETLAHEFSHLLFNRHDAATERALFSLNTNSPGDFNVPLPDPRIYRRIQDRNSADPDNDAPNDNIVNWARRVRTARFPVVPFASGLGPATATTGNKLTEPF